MKVAAALCTLMIGLAGQAAAECRLALVLGMDVSASVDAAEYDLQMRGTAAALLSPAVRAAILGGEPIALAAFLWSGVGEQRQLGNWMVIDSATALEVFASDLAAQPRPPFRGRTGTGAAMRFGQQMLAQAPSCTRRVLDLATDGERNDGVDPAAVEASGITINALSIGGDLPFEYSGSGDPLRPLSVWLQKRVIRGQAAFVEKAADYRDFETAMTRKLFREVSELLLGAVDPAKSP